MYPVGYMHVSEVYKSDAYSEPHTPKTAQLEFIDK